MKFTEAAGYDLVDQGGMRCLGIPHREGFNRASGQKRRRGK